MPRYLIVIEKEDGNYAGYVPDLPGCVTTGTTIEETKRNMQEAVSGHIQNLREHGDSVPEPRTVAADYVDVVLYATRAEVMNVLEEVTKRHEKSFRKLADS